MFLKKKSKQLEHCTHRKESCVTTVVQSVPKSLYWWAKRLFHIMAAHIKNKSHFVFVAHSCCPCISSHLPPRCRLSAGAACSEKQQSEIFQSRHCCAAQWPHSGSLQLDPVLSGPHAVFRWSTLTAINPEKSPVQRNLQDISSLLSAELWSRWLPRGLWAPALQLPGFGLPNF